MEISLHQVTKISAYTRKFGSLWCVQLTIDRAGESLRVDLFGGERQPRVDHRIVVDYSTGVYTIQDYELKTITVGKIDHMSAEGRPFVITTLDIKTRIGNWIIPLYSDQSLGFEVGDILVDATSNNDDEAYE